MVRTDKWELLDMKTILKFIFFAFITFILIYVFLVVKTWCFLKIEISEDFYIQQKPFQNNYILKKSDGTHIVEYVAEWRLERNYVFGAVYKAYFVYDIEDDSVKIIDDIDDFYDYLRPLELEYTMDNCDYILNYRSFN